MREGSPISCGSGSDSRMGSTSDIVYRTFDLPAHVQTLVPLSIIGLEDFSGPTYLSFSTRIR